MVSGNKSVREGKIYAELREGKLQKNNNYMLQHIKLYLA